jgi:cellulose synthase/poly-beta-1,6-N-acetylglucosamine synthase-like glycosyltransferase
VQRCVTSIRDACEESQFANYEVKIVTDGSGSEISGADKIVVPASYTPQNKSRFKARSLSYALSVLPHSLNVWYLHLDEDAHITSQGVKSVLSYIIEGGKPVSNGPSVYPLQKSIWGFFAEAHRQWTFYWLRGRLENQIPLWMNGSNMLIRSDIEHSVGWDHPISKTTGQYISEDTRFAYEAKKKFGDVFGWHGGLTIEAPPPNVFGVIRQRQRWFYGGLLILKYIPKTQLPRRLYSSLSWVDGFFLGVMSILWITGIYTVSFWFAGIIIFTRIFWIGRYQLGLYRNLRYSNIALPDQIVLHIGLAVLTPVVELLCTLPTVYALIHPPKTFEITEKI